MHPSLVAWQQPTDAAAEAFRQLSAIVAAAPDSALKSIGVTAPTDGTGRSAVAANLAVALTQSGKRVTLVDGDLRMPTLHTLFEADNTAGLSAVLLGSADARAALRDSGIPQLALLPAGPATQDSHQLLAGPAKATLLQSLTQQADYVVLNLPPVLGRSDALELAPLVDGVFLLLRAGSSSSADGQKAASLLRQVNVNVLGILLSNAAP